MNLQSLFFVGISLFIFVVSAQAQSQDSPVQSDAGVWEQLQALSGTQTEDSLWNAAETATERVFGRALDRDTGETVFQALEAATDRDWRSALETAGPAALSAYLPGIGQYIETIQGAANQIDRATDRWAVQLYDHDSYRWIVAQVDAREARMNRPMMDDYGDPYFGRINDHDEAFMPSYALPDGSAAKERARQFEAELFERFQSQSFYAELIATDYTDNGGGASGLYENSYAAMIREELGYQPEPRRLFSHFYHRYTRDRLDRYFEVHEYVQAEHMRRAARRTRQDLIDAYRAARDAEPVDFNTMLEALQNNDNDGLRAGIDAGFDINAIVGEPGASQLPFMYYAGLVLAENPNIQSTFDILIAAGGNVRPRVAANTPEPLLIALRNYGETSALALIDAGYRTETGPNSQMLRAAVEQNYAQIVGRLLAAGHDPNVATENGVTPLHAAVMNDRTEIVTMLLAAGADPSMVRHEGGNALHFAALHNRAALIAPLVSAGAPINALLNPENRPLTALMIAAMQGHMSTVQALVSAGADARIETDRGSAADLARANGHIDIADYLDELADPLASMDSLQIREMYLPQVLEAVRNFDGRELIRILDELGPEHQRNPLYACARGEAPFCDGTRIGGFAAYHMAYSGDLAALSRLAETGLSLDFVNTDGTTSTLIAAMNGAQHEALRYLLEQGLDPNAVMSNGATALSFATDRNATRMVEILLRAGADPNVGRLNGISPLHAAAIHNNRSMINVLRQAGAQIQTDDRGNPPGYYTYWLHRDENLAIELGYEDARRYGDRERRRNQPGFDWAEFAREMQPALAATVQELQAAQAQNYQDWQDDDEDFVIEEFERWDYDISASSGASQGQSSGSASGSCQPDGVVTLSRTGTDGIDVRLNEPCGSFTGRANYCGMNVYVWEAGGISEAPGTPSGPGGDRLFVKTRSGEILASCE
ncbi:ankyrin repeat domain-containing protein [Hyphobacterium sp.]|uniref:ankyrin repeat domain-containing protein n=1 Tax=Hyphobacterium sp. TaxID=2004662 RepID=UPI003747E662